MPQELCERRSESQGGGDPVNANPYSGRHWSVAGRRAESFCQLDGPPKLLGEDRHLQKSSEDTGQRLERLTPGVA